MKSNCFLWGMIFFVGILFCSCDDSLSYSDMKEKERKAILTYIRDQGIKVISYKQFIEQDSVTKVADNEYVLIDDVYMQIVRNPKDVEGSRKILDDETMPLMARYTEYNIQDGETLSGNLYDSDNPDYLRITYKNGSYSGTFTSGYMLKYYKTGAVPTGWFTPFPYLYLTRPQSQIAKVNLIVPHSKGTPTASSYVYPCLYQITFQPERLYDTD